MKNIAEYIDENYTDESVWVLYSSVSKTFFQEYFLEKKGFVKNSKFRTWKEVKDEFKLAKRDLKESSEFSRRVFVESILKKNAQLPFLKKIIPKKFEKDFGFITNYFVNMLPFLSNFVNKIENADELRLCFEEGFYEDIKSIYIKYKSFLQERGFYERSYEKLNIKYKEKYNFVYPELYGDFFEYSSQFEKLSIENNRFSLEIPVLTPAKAEIKLYANVELEIEGLFAKIRELLSMGTDASKIIISAAKLENIRELLLKKSKEYDIKIEFKSKQSYILDPLVRFFKDILDFFESGISLKALKKLFLNKTYPLKQRDKLKTIINHIQKYSFFANDKSDLYKRDLIEEILQHEDQEELLRVYKELKKDLLNIYNQKSFKGINESLHLFMNTHFILIDNENKSVDMDKKNFDDVLKIIGDFCIEEEKLAEKLDMPFSFFVEYLGKNGYLNDDKSESIKIYEYPRSIGAIGVYNFVVNLFQESSKLDFKKNFFLQEDIKQKFVNKEECNISRRVLENYANNQNTYISGSREDYSGRLLPCIDFFKKDLIEIEEIEFSQYKIEKMRFANQNLLTPYKPNLLEQEGFLNFLETSLYKQDELKNENRGHLELSNKRVQEYISCKRKYHFDANLKCFKEIEGKDFEMPINTGNLYDTILKHTYNELIKIGLKIHNKESLEIAKKIVTDRMEKILNKNKVQSKFKIVPYLLKIKGEFYLKSMQNTLSWLFERFNLKPLLSNEINPKKETNFDFVEDDIKFTVKMDKMIKDMKEEVGQVHFIDFKKKFNEFEHVLKSNYFEENKRNVLNMQLLLYSFYYRKKIEQENREELFKKQDYKAFLYYVGIENTSASKEFFEKTEDFREFILENYTNDVINTIIDGIRNGNFEAKNIMYDTKQKIFFEEDTSIDTCKKCDFKEICRRTFSI